MDYQKHYTLLINKAKSRGLDKSKLEGYYEKHHIVPKCIGGSDDPSNLVLLTYREHYIAHVFLAKTAKGKDKAKLVYAVRSFRMSIGERKLSSRQLERIKLMSAKLNPITLPDATDFADHLLDKLGKELNPWQYGGLGNLQRFLDCQQSKEDANELAKILAFYQAATNTLHNSTEAKLYAQLKAIGVIRDGLLDEELIKKYKYEVCKCLAKLLEDLGILVITAKDKDFYVMSHAVDYLYDLLNQCLTYHALTGLKKLVSFLYIKCQTHKGISEELIRELTKAGITLQSGICLWEFVGWSGFYGDHADYGSNKLYIPEQIMQDCIAKALRCRDEFATMPYAYTLFPAPW